MFPGNYQTFIPNDIRHVKEPELKNYQFKGGPYNNQFASMRLCGPETFTFTVWHYVGRYKKAGSVLKWEPRYVPYEI